MIRSADVIVIGGGVIGCAVARELARRGTRVVVLERGRVAAEATAAAAGLIAPQAECEGPGPVLRLALLSRARYATWAEALREESGIDVEYRTDGIVYAALTTADARALVARARWQRAAGLRVERLTASEGRRRVPVLTARARAVHYFPDDHRLNNERLGIAVARGAQRAGAVILEGTTVHAVRVQRGRVTGVDSTSGRIAAPVVVNAAGAWAAAVTIPGGTPPPIAPVRGQMLVLRAGLDVLPQPLYANHRYLVPRLDGRVLAGSTLEHAGFEKRVTVAAAADILASVLRVAPDLAGCTVESSYAGLRPATPDRLPLLGSVREPAGLVYATGHYRHGILLAPVTGQAIADLVLTGRTALPVEALSPARFC